MNVSVSAEYLADLVVEARQGRRLTEANQLSVPDYSHSAVDYLMRVLEHAGLGQITGHSPERGLGVRFGKNGGREMHLTVEWGDG